MYIESELNAALLVTRKQRAERRGAFLVEVKQGEMAVDQGVHLTEDYVFVNIPTVEATRDFVVAEMMAAENKIFDEESGNTVSFRSWQIDPVGDKLSCFISVGREA